MNIFDWITLSLCFLLLINKASRSGAFILIAGKLFYFALIIDTSAIWYYALSATLNLIMGRFLYDEYKISAFCAFLTVPVNIFGFWLWFNFYPPDLYNVIFSIVLAVQLMFIAPRILTHGKHRYSIKYPMDVLASFDSCSVHDTMHKTHKGKKTR